MAKQQPKQEPDAAPVAAAEAAVTGGKQYHAPKGYFSYIRPNGRKVLWNMADFTVTDPDVVRELKFYVDKGFLEEAGSS